MKSGFFIKLVLALLLLGGAGYLGSRHFMRDDGVTEQTFFYDLSEKKLFAAPLETLPPIKGLNDSQEDAVRAIVITTSTDLRDESAQRIAYLEKYAPELKQHLGDVRDGKVEPMSSKARNALRFVKRPADPDWHPVSSPEGSRILSEWNVPGPDGRSPAVCVP